MIFMLKIVLVRGIEFSILVSSAGNHSVFMLKIVLVVSIAFYTQDVVLCTVYSF